VAGTRRQAGGPHRGWGVRARQRRPSKAQAPAQAQARQGEGRLPGAGRPAEAAGVPAREAPGWCRGSAGWRCVPPWLPCWRQPRVLPSRGPLRPPLKPSLEPLKVPLPDPFPGGASGAPAPGVPDVSSSMMSLLQNISAIVKKPDDK